MPDCEWQTLHDGRGGDPWYTLDNGAKIYPSVTSARLPGVFRLSVTLTQAVDAVGLQKALDAVMERFPYFRVHLRRGFFWYYFARAESRPSVLPDSRPPCKMIPIKKKDEFLFRVLFSDRRIAVEFSHALTDGHGALVFLKTLTAGYLTGIHGAFADWGDIFRPGDVPEPEETEDAFRKNFRRDSPPPRALSSAYHLPYRYAGPGAYAVITGIIPLREISATAKGKKVTINDFLVAAFLDAYQEAYFGHLPARHRKPKDPIRIIVPKNLRNLFNSRTMRNFVLFIRPDIDPRLGRYGFDELLGVAHHCMKLGDSQKPYLPEIGRNVGSERTLLLRLLPRKVKDILFAWAFSAFGEKPSSGSVSNLGVVHMPEDMARHIERFEFTPAPGPVSTCNCGVIGFGNTVAVTFGRTIRETDVEKYFFRRLVRCGIPVKIFAHGG